MDEETFKLFESFDFENSQQFQTGWAAIVKLIDQEKKESEYERAQSFFFSRNVKSFDYEQYMVWRNVKGKKEDKPEREISPESGCADPEQSLEESSLSLAEVADLIQSNKPIPGIVSVDVKPSNAEPTASMMARKLKPWETAEVNNVSVSELIKGGLSDDLSRSSGAIDDT